MIEILRSKNTDLTSALDGWATEQGKKDELAKLQDQASDSTSTDIRMTDPDSLRISTYMHDIFTMTFY